MTLEEFAASLKVTVPLGPCWKTQGAATSTITNYTQAFITYRRGKSSISISYEKLFQAYLAYKGRKVSASDLRQFAPSVFDSSARPAGHSCNVTLLFLILNSLGLSSEIGGSGVKGDPYFVSIP